MAMKLLCIAITAFALRGVVVDSSGTVYVDPAERAREERGTELLRDANAYYKGGNFDSDAANVAIQKYEAVLHEVDLMPKLRQDVVFKLAELLRVQGGNILIGANPPDESKAALGRSDFDRAAAYYAEILSGGLDAGRPALLADSLIGMGDIHTTLKEFEKAIGYFEQARKIASNESLPLDQEWTAQRKHSRSSIAESRIANAIHMDLNARALVRERAESDNHNDAEVAHAAAARTSENPPHRAGGASQPATRTLAEPPAGPWSFHTAIALAGGALTIGLIVALRKGTQPGPQEKP